MSRKLRLFAAFTLVELLVVIGVIAIVIGLLLPTLAGAQGRARDIKCQSNLRLIIQGFYSYAVENKGSMPYGYYYDPSDPVTFEPIGDTDRLVCWPAQIGKYMTRGGAGNSDDYISPIFNCPEAEQVFTHKLSYAMNVIVGIVPRSELSLGSPPRAQTKPPQITAMLKDTALVWDESIKRDHTAFNGPGGYLMGHDIDDRRFRLGARTPQYRYWRLNDVFARIPPGIFGHNRPIVFGGSGGRWLNIDPIDPSIGYPYEGNLRFRHRKQNACNVGYSDGHVAQFSAKFNPDGTMRTHDALRRYFMIKWPPGVPPDTSVPH